jgi:hypothetical protein
LDFGKLRRDEIVAGDSRFLLWARVELANRYDCNYNAPLDTRYF